MVGGVGRPGIGEPLVNELDMRYTFKAVRGYVIRIPSTLQGGSRTYDTAVQVVLTRRDVSLCLAVF